MPPFYSIVIFLPWFQVRTLKQRISGLEQENKSNASQLSGTVQPPPPNETTL